MQKYTIFHAPLMSFFSLSFYRDVGLRWIGTGLAYLLLLLTICSIPALVKMQLSISDFISNKAPAIIYQIPSIKIVNGEASTDIAQSYQIIDPDSKKVIAIVDTTSNTISLQGTDAKILLTKTDVISKKNDVETRTYNLKIIENFSIDLKKIVIWLDMFRKFAAFFLFPFIVIGSFIYRTMQLLIYGVIGLLFAERCKTKLTYKALLRLSAMAVTPPIIVGTILEIAGIKFPLLGLIFFMAAMIYLFIAVKAVSNPE